MIGWIKMHRSVMDWEWYKDINTKVLFIHMLLLANTEDKEWHGTIVKRGQFISSIQKLSEQTGLSFAQVRRCISNLKKTNEIIHVNKTKYGLFTIVNYNKYQGTEKAEIPKTEPKKEKTRKSTSKEYTDEFEQFWYAYPRKVEKAGAFSCWNARLKEKCAPSDMISAAKRYSEQCKQNNTEDRYIKHATTFLGAKKPFEDFIVKAKEKKVEEKPKEQEKPVDYGWEDD